MNSSERRSSRSIKRKRFDDEIVDYKFTSPVNRSHTRPRTSSVSNTPSTSTPTKSSVSNATPQTLVTTPAAPTVTASPVVTSAPTISSPQTPVPLPQIVQAKKVSPLPSPVPQKPPAPIPAPVQTVAPAPAPVPVMPIKTESAPVISNELLEHKISKTFTPPGVTIACPAPVAPTLLPQVKLEPLQVNSPVTHTSSPRESLSSTPYSGLHLHAERMKTSKSAKKKNGKKSTATQLSTKDLGRWKPVDDLALILGVQQTNDLKMVHRGVKFSCKFTLNELQNRWYALLYEESVSRIAVAAMRNLHPELVENIQSKALFSLQEEEILATIKSTENPSLDTFADLLRKNATTFFSSRTPKGMLRHWQLMKQFCLLPDQVLKVPGKDNAVLSFSDNEELMNDTEIMESKDEVLDAEMAKVDRRNKRQIRQLENELGRWNVLVDSMTGMGFPPEFDRQTLAVLRGRLVRYLMRSREITIGRSTKDSSVDVDLCLEGPALKVSRKQGTIKLRSNADFFLTNEGKRPIYVDGVALLKGLKMRLSHNCVIEIAGLRFTFLVNFDLINAIQQESAKMNTPLT